MKIGRMIREPRAITIPLPRRAPTRCPTIIARPTSKRRHFENANAISAATLLARFRTFAVPVAVRRIAVRFGNQLDKVRAEFRSL